MAQRSSRKKVSSLQHYRDRCPRPDDRCTSSYWAVLSLSLRRSGRSENLTRYYYCLSRLLQRCHSRYRKLGNLSVELAHQSLSLPQLYFEDRGKAPDCLSRHLRRSNRCRRCMHRHGSYLKEWDRELSVYL